MFRRWARLTHTIDESLPQSALGDNLAHVTEDGRPHLLVEHLRKVGEGAAAFLPDPLWSRYAEAAGRWHDLGKYSPTFQNMIRRVNGFEAHLEEREDAPRDHSTAGALYALQQLGDEALPIAFAIAGHHAGLSDLSRLQSRLEQKQRLLQDALDQAPDASVLTCPIDQATTVSGLLRHAPLEAELWTRMLFSALCDADFLDTERFYDLGRAAHRIDRDSIHELCARLTKFISHLAAGAPESSVNTARMHVQRCAVHAAKQPSGGVFELAVPTGGGKTLASMRFALEHAVRNGLQRVVVAIPYTSIIEQNADVYRRALGAQNVIEHHSSLEPRRATYRNRLASENWDAPIIVTTTVQLLESLFANRTSKCRKLHRLRNAVIVLDEAQTFPPEQLAPIVSMLSGLAERHNTSVVVCTATQPALRRRDRFKEGFRETSPIVPKPERLFKTLKRVEVEWPDPDADALSYASLAKSIAGLDKVLAIVHLRADARELVERVDERLHTHTCFHLSALMHASHRTRVLQRIREALAKGGAVRVVATQLVEAGVDLDFPVVYRALAGLDSVAQAAGRCNREGKATQPGRVIAFRAPTLPPPGPPRLGLETTRSMLRTIGALDINDPNIYGEYFRRFYRNHNLDKHEIQAKRGGFEFQKVAQEFRMIDNDWAASLVIPDPAVQRSLNRLRDEGPSRGLLRQLQRYTVSISKQQLQRWVDTEQVAVLADTVTVLAPALMNHYCDRFGLRTDRLDQRDKEQRDYA